MTHVRNAHRYQLPNLTKRKTLEHCVSKTYGCKRKKKDIFLCKDVSIYSNDKKFFFSLPPNKRIVKVSSVSFFERNIETVFCDWNEAILQQLHRNLSLVIWNDLKVPEHVENQSFDF